MLSKLTCSDPAVKRSLCSCGTVLVPGLTSRVRVKREPRRAVAVESG